MACMFSGKAWKNWWRTKRYQFYAWGLSPKPDMPHPRNLANCFGYRVPECRAALNEVRMEQKSVELLKAQAVHERNKKDYDTLRAEQYKMARKKRADLASVKLDKARLLALPGDPAFIRFWRDYKSKSKAVGDAKLRMDLAGAKIDAIKKVIENCERFANNAEHPGEQFDDNAHMEYLMTGMDPASIARSVATGDATSDRFEVLMGETEAARGLGVGATQVDAAAEQAEMASFLSMIMQEGGSEREFGDVVAAERGAGRIPRKVPRGAAVIQPQLIEDGDVMDDMTEDDVLVFSSVGRGRGSSAKNKRNMGRAAATDGRNSASSSSSVGGRSGGDGFSSEDL